MKAGLIFFGFIFLFFSLLIFKAITMHSLKSEVIRYCGGSFGTWTHDTNYIVCYGDENGSGNGIQFYKKIS